VDVTDRTDDAASFITPVSVLFSTFTRLNPAMGPDLKKMRHCSKAFVGGRLF